MDILAAIAHLECLRFVTRSFTLFADQLNVGKELHFYRNRAIALAGFTAPPRNVEGEVAGGETALFRLREGGKQVANSIESLDVGDGIGTRSPPNGGLVDKNDIVD